MIVSLSTHIAKRKTKPGENSPAGAAIGAICIALVFYFPLSIAPLSVRHGLASATRFVVGSLLGFIRMSHHKSTAALEAAQADH
jgi:hypothetical protein